MSISNAISESDRYLLFVVRTGHFGAVDVVALSLGYCSSSGRSVATLFSSEIPPFPARSEVLVDRHRPHRRTTRIREVLGPAYRRHRRTRHRKSHDRLSYEVVDPVLRHCQNHQLWRRQHRCGPCRSVAKKLSMNS